MATHIVATKPQEQSKGDLYDLGMLRLCQAKALTEVLGIAAKHADGGVPMEGASWGVIELMKQGEDAFRDAFQFTKED